MAVAKGHKVRGLVLYIWFSLHVAVIVVVYYRSQRYLLRITIKKSISYLYCLVILINPLIGMCVLS